LRNAAERIDARRREAVDSRQLFYFIGSSEQLPQKERALRFSVGPPGDCQPEPVGKQRARTPREPIIPRFPGTVFSLQGNAMQ
jgi:hypothetical protein